jgi:hypothetical protein
MSSNAASTLGFNRVAIVTKDGISSRDLRKWFEKIEQKTFNLFVNGTFTAADLTGPLAVSTAGPLIASGSLAMGTGAVGSGASRLNSAVATGVVTTDIIQWSFNATPAFGYAPASTGSLYILAYPSADHVNFLICNPTGGSITPGAMTVNYQVIR